MWKHRLLAQARCDVAIASGAWGKGNGSLTARVAHIIPENGHFFYFELPKTSSYYSPTIHTITIGSTYRHEWKQNGLTMRFFNQIKLLCRLLLKAVWHHSANHNTIYILLSNNIVTLFSFIWWTFSFISFRAQWKSMNAIECLYEKKTANTLAIYFICTTKAQLKMP